MKLQVVYFLVVSLCFAASTSANLGDKAYIYYFGWDVLTRERTDYRDVRKDTRYKTKLEVNNNKDVTKLKEAISNLDSIDEKGHFSDVNARLVIDFYYINRGYNTIIADQFYFYALDDEGNYQKKMKLTEHVKNLFRVSFDTERIKGS